jgi:hypothetical protein
MLQLLTVVAGLHAAEPCASDAVCCLLCVLVTLRVAAMSSCVGAIEAIGRVVVYDEEGLGA